MARDGGQGTVDLLKLSGGTGMAGSGRVGLRGPCSAAVAVPVTSFQEVNRRSFASVFLGDERWRRSEVG